MRSYTLLLWAYKDTSFVSCLFFFFFNTAYAYGKADKLPWVTLLSLSLQTKTEQHCCHFDNPEYSCQVFVWKKIIKYNCCPYKDVEQALSNTS